MLAAHSETAGSDGCIGRKNEAATTKVRREISRESRVESAGKKKGDLAGHYTLTPTNYLSWLPFVGISRTVKHRIDRYGSLVEVKDYDKGKVSYF